MQENQSKLSKRALDMLMADVQSQRLADSYLFVGQHNAVLRAGALELAKAVNCLGEESVLQEEPGLFLEDPVSAMPKEKQLVCNLCESCRKINENIHPDVFVLDFESQGVLLGLKEDEIARQKEFRIDSVRALVSQSVRSPMQGRKKFFIIDGAENLNIEAANALLKALEESATHSHWILLSCAAERLLGTIQSRCRKMMIAAQTQIVTEQTTSPLVQEALDFLLEAGSAQEVFNLSTKILAEKKKSSNQRKIAEEFLRELALATSAALHRDADIKIAQRLQDVLSAQSDLSRNANPQLVLDTLFLGT